jgi:hypothetical protein
MTRRDTSTVKIIRERGWTGPARCERDEKFVWEEGSDLHAGRKAHFVDSGDIRKDGKESRRDRDGDTLRGPKNREPVRPLTCDPGLAQEQKPLSDREEEGRG